MNYFYVTCFLKSKGTRITEKGMGAKLTDFAKHCKARYYYGIIGFSFFPEDFRKYLMGGGGVPLFVTGTPYV